MRICMIAILLLSLLLTGCDLLFGSQDYVDKTLWPLQSAIEAELGLSAESAADEAAPAGIDHAAADTSTHDAAEPVHVAAADDDHVSDNADEPLPADETETEQGSVQPATALDAVAVVSVVDTTSIATTEEEPDPELLAAALRRERVVRQAVNNALVENKLINVVQPDETNTTKARDEIIAKNSAALSAPLTAEIGEEIGAAVIVCALIDNQGAEVNIVAQLATNGKLIYQDTIKDWEIVTAEEADEEE